MKAFPIVIDRETQLANNTNFAVQEDGMDLRDYFAGQVIIGFLANNKTDYSNRHIVELAYAMADEMIKRREI